MCINYTNLPTKDLPVSIQLDLDFYSSAFNFVGSMYQRFLENKLKEHNDRMNEDEKKNGKLSAFNYFWAQELVSLMNYAENLAQPMPVLAKSTEDQIPLIIWDLHKLNFKLDLNDFNLPLVQYACKYEEYLKSDVLPKSTSHEKLLLFCALLKAKKFEEAYNMDLMDLMELQEDVVDDNM